MNFLQRFWGHLKTVNSHRRLVRKLCFKLGFIWRGLTHDLSKYSIVEFFRGVRYYTGKRSPHVGERADNGYSAAWLHHKARNKHHPEYWVDIINGLPTPVEMPFEYIIEMFCDRIAASKTYLKDKYTDSSALNYYISHKDENPMHPKTREKIEFYLKHLAEKGEDCTFEMIKSQRRNSK